jgi:FeS assembly protein SufD
MEISKSFVENISQVCNEPEWLKEFRLNSLKHFESLPVEQSELFLKYYKHDAIDLNVERFDYKVIFKEEIESGINVKNCIVTTSEGIEKKVSCNDKPFVFTDIFSAIKSKSQIKELITNTKIEDKLEGLNNALFNSGIFIYVPENTIVAAPLRSIFIINKRNSAIFNKTIIIVDKCSKLNFVEEVYSYNSSDCIYSENLEVFAKEGSSVNITFIQNTDYGTQNFINRKIFSNGKVSLFTSNVGGKLTKYRVESYLNKDGAEFESYDMFFGNADQKFDVFSRATHISPNTKSRVISRTILKDSARALLKGIIKILKEAKNTQAYLEEHSILLSKECRADSIPSLEIETYDVKATHSASTQQLDANQIFYLMSRGLPEEEAKKIVALGFLEPVLKSFMSNSLRRCIENMIESKWNNSTATTFTIPDLSDYRVVEKEGVDIFSGHYKYR